MDNAPKQTMRKVMIGARVVQALALLAGVALAAPELLAQFVTYERAADWDRVILIAGICLPVVFVASWIASGIKRGLDEHDTELKVAAGLGEQFVIESDRGAGFREVYRVMTDDAPPPALPLSPLKNAVVEQIGGSGVAVGLTVFVWLLAAVVLLAATGVVHGQAPGAAAIGGMVAFTVIAAAVMTFRHRTVLSNRDQAVHTELTSLGLRRRRSRPYADFTAVKLRHAISHAESSTISHSDQGSRHVPASHSFNILLSGENEFILQTLNDAFRARRRAEQLAAYIGLPLVDPEVEDVASLSVLPPPG